MAYASYSASYAKPPPPKAAQKLTKQREIAEYADFAVRGVHVPDPTPVRVDGKHRDQVKSIAFSKSGRVVATGGLDKTVRFWDVKYRREKGKAGVEVSFVYNATRSPLLPSSSSATTSSDAGSSSSKPTTTAEAPILRLAFSPTDENLLAIALAGRPAGRDRDKREAEGPAVVLWNVDPSNLHLLASFPLDGEFQSIAFHPSGLALAIACFRRSAWDAVVFVWDEEAVRRQEEKPEDVEGQEMVVDTAADGLAGGEQLGRRWSVRRDIKLGDRNYRIKDRRGREWGVRELNGLCFSPDGRRLYAGETSGNIFAWEYPVLPAPVPPVEDAADAGNGANGDVNMQDGTQSGDLKADGLTVGANGDGAETAAPSALPSREGSPVHEGDGRAGSPPREEQPEETSETGDLEATEQQEDKVEDAVEGTTSAAAATAADTKAGAEAAEQSAVEDANTDIAADQDEAGNDGTIDVKKAAADRDADVEMASADEPSPADDAGTATPAPVGSQTPAPEPAATGSPQAGDAVEKPDAAEAKPDVPTITVDADGDTEMQAADSEAATAQDKPAEEKTPIANAPAESKKDETAAAAATEAAATAPAPPAEPAKPKVPEVPATMLKYLFQVGCHSGCANCLEVSPDGRFVATGGSEGVVNQIDLSSWITVRAYDSYTEEVRNVKCSYDGEWIAVVGDDRCIDIMSVVSGTTAVRIPTKTKVECMAWVPIRSKSILCYSLEDHLSGAAGQAGDWFWVEM